MEPLPKPFLPYPSGQEPVEGDWKEEVSKLEGDRVQKELCVTTATATATATEIFLQWFFSLTCLLLMEPSR